MFVWQDEAYMWDCLAVILYDVENRCFLVSRDTHAPDSLPTNAVSPSEKSRSRDPDVDLVDSWHGDGHVSFATNEVGVCACRQPSVCALSTSYNFTHNLSCFGEYKVVVPPIMETPSIVHRC